ARPAAVQRVVLGAARALGALRPVRGRCGRRLPRLALGVSLVLVHGPARRPSPSARLVPRRRPRTGGGVPIPSGRRRVPRGTLRLSAARGAGVRAVVLRTRPRLLGNAVEPGRRPLARRLPWAAFLVPHRPVLVPPPGPGPAPRCL